jgi:glycosyltransferase involved in cell wall biosynthesis
MPKVVFVLPVLEPAGAERIVAELARRLPKLGFDTAVLCLEDERAPIGVELSAAGIPVAGLRRSRRSTLTCARELAGKFRELKPEIVHAHLFHANMATRFARLKLNPDENERIRLINTVHVAERRFRPWQFYMERKTAVHAQCEVCVSQAVAEFQRKRTKLPKDFFRVIENGIDLAKFTPPLEKGGQGGVSRKTATPPDPPFSRGGERVVSVGRLDPQKDYPTLLRAWKKVSARFPAATLTIAGDGPERKALGRLCRKLALERVDFAGFVKDIPSLLRSADLYVQPSAWEGFGLAVAEAMATALPVIVSDADSLPEIVAHDRTGLVVPKGKPVAQAAAMIELLGDLPRARKLGRAAREEALNRFSVERMVEEYAKLYRELLAE